jgi:iron complex outermembrane receptor protein
MKTTNCTPTLLAALAAAVTAAFWTPCVTRAADTGGESASDTLEEVIVTATRREEKLHDVPISASALSGEPLAAFGDAGDDIKQLAFKVPSLNIESSNGRAFPRFYIRGYGNTDFHDFASQPVSLVYDDIVQENPALKGFPIFDQADVEVLRGPQGTLFGRNSPAGVVKLESAKPQLGETSSYVTLSDGTYNSANIQAVANLPINDQMAFRASVQGQHRDNWINDPINLTKLGGYEDWGARLQLLYVPSDTFTALFNVHGRSLNGSSTVFRANIISYGTNSLVPGFDPATTYSDGPNSSTLSTIGANVHLTWNLPNLTLQSISGYESVQNYLAVGDIDGGYGPGFFCGPPSPAYVCAQPSGPGPIPFSVQTSAGVLDHKQLTEEFRVVSKNSGPLQGQAGVFLFYENVAAADDNYCSPGDTAPSCGSLLWTLQDTTAARQKNDAEAIFGSLEYSASSMFKVRAGVRYTEDHKTFDILYSTAANPPSPPNHASQGANNVSWDLSPTFEVNPNVNLYARIATGFRAPSFGTPALGLPIQLARSENNISYETGVKADLFDRRARVAFDVFYFDVSHQQLTAVGGAANVIQLINASNTIGKGAELDFDAHLTPNLVFSLSGSLNDTKIHDPGLSVAPCFNFGGTDHCNVLNPPNPTNSAAVEINGNPLPQAAKWIADVSLRYDIPLGNGSTLYAFTDWSYRSSMDLFLYSATEFNVPAHTEGGLRLGYTWSDGKYDVAAFCRNCANQIRVIGGIDFENATGFINDPRIIGAQLKAKF